jgi:hypothetical protein
LPFFASLFVDFVFGWGVPGFNTLLGINHQKSRYYVERRARNEAGCAKARYYWTDNESRCALALDPGQ